MFKGIIITLLMFVFSNKSEAQSDSTTKDGLKSSALKILNESKLRKAELLYDHFAYTEAIGLYEVLYAANFDKALATKRLAECYRHTEATDKAEIMYAAIVASDTAKAEDIYNYAQMLRSNGKYEQSVQWMEKFHYMSGIDSRGIMYSQSKDFIKTISTAPENCKLKLAAELNSVYSDFGAFSQNNKIVFVSARDVEMTIQNKYAWDEKPFLNIYSTTKTDSGLTPIVAYGKKINSKFHDGPACFAKDGVTMYFTRNNFLNGRKTNSSKGINNLKILKCTILGAKITELVDLPFNSSEYSVGHPSIDEINHRLFFASDMPGGRGGTDIYYVEMNSDGSYGTPVNIGSPVNTEGDELFPFYHESGILFFSSNGQVGLGGLDIFVAEPDENGEFKKVANLGIPLNSKSDDFSFFLDQQQKFGFIASNRPNGMGDDDIYSFQLFRPVYFRIPVKVIARDKETNDGIAGSTIKVLDQDGKIYFEGVTASDGSVFFVSEPDKDFKIMAVADQYLDNSLSFSTRNMNEAKEVSLVVSLEKNPGFTLVCLITDRSTGKPLSNVQIIINDKKTNFQLIDYTTGEEGGFKKPLPESRMNDELYYEVKIKCEGYLDKSLAYYKKLTNPGEILLHEELDLKMDKIEVGTDLAKIIDIKPIYFDLGKSNIRPDAAVELDKIVQVMKDNQNMVIELRSHTDSRGDDASNMKLSDKRAKSSAQYIISKGIESTRIYGKGYGESMLLNSCGNGVKCTEEEHQINRRTEFIIIKM